MKVFIFGFGKVSKELAKKLSNEKKINFKIVSRNTENFLDYEFLKIDFFKNKLNFSDSILISTIPPNEKGDDYILKNIPESNLKSFSRIIYISSTSVYQSGNVVRDKSCKPFLFVAIFSFWHEFDHSGN